jgi:hypothetical protein
MWDHQPNGLYMINDLFAIFFFEQDNVWLDDYYILDIDVGE